MGLGHGRRASLAITLNLVAFAFALSAVTTSYWCEGTRKVVKPFCTGSVKVKQWYCIRFNSSNINDSRLVQYIWESGEEKFLMRKFHTGIFFSCEQAADMNGFECRDFSEIAPEHERGVLWLCMVAETLYLGLLFMGGALMTMEQCPCFSVMNKLKLNAFAAMCTALSGLCGMLAHMMFTTAFQLAVIMGPEDWRPKTWDYSWSYLLAWGSFGTCMGSAVTALNRYTKTIVEFKYKRRNIEKSLRIKQKLMELDLQDHMWDMHMTVVPDGSEAPLDLAANGHKPPCGTSYVLDLAANGHKPPCGTSYVLDLAANGHKPPCGTSYVVDLDNAPDHQGEIYC